VSAWPSVAADLRRALLRTDPHRQHHGRSLLPDPERANLDADDREGALHL
jgi:hypothetical protein